VLNILLALILISVSTIIITVGVYAWLNKEDKNVIEIKQTLKLLGGDTSNLIKNLRLLGGIVSEVAKPLLNPAAIDVESEYVEEKKEEKALEVVLTEEGQILEIEEAEMKRKEVKKEDSKEDVVKEEVEADVDERILEDETDLIAELIKEDDNKERLEVAMAQWRAKGNERLALACAVALEELKVKREKNQEVKDAWSTKQ